MRTRPPGRRGLAIHRGLRGDGTYWMVIGSALAGVAAYLFQVVGTRALGEQGYAPISALWTLQYLVVSVFLYSVETYVTRETVVPSGADRPWARVWGWIAAVAVVLAGACWYARGPLFGGRGDLAVVTALIVVSFGAFVVVRGRLAGLGRFRLYGVVTASESVARLAMCLAVVVAALATTRWVAWTMPVGAAAAAAWWLVAGRRPAPARSSAALPVAPAGTGRYLVSTAGANAVAQLLLAGGPLALVAMSAAPADVSVFFVTFTAARAPVVLAFGGVLSRLVPTFSRLARTGGTRGLRRVARRIGAGSVVVAAVGGLAGALVGSRLIVLFFGAGFAPPWWLAAGAAVTVLLATGSLVLHQLFIVHRLERRLAPPWAGALGVAVAVAAVAGGSASARVTAAAVAGQATALAGLVLAARSPVRSRPR